MTLLQFYSRVLAYGPMRLGEWFMFLLLVPFSFLYAVVVWLRNKAYDRFFFAVEKISIPVVSVGNITVGGTGKTPVVDLLIKIFQQSGKRVAVVSRGYGGSYSTPVGIVADEKKMRMEAHEAGDEPYLLALKNPGAVILVARRRVLGVRMAIQKYSADVVILDDGFQHRAVGRKLDLVLLDACRPFGNGWVLPAGSLRELPGSLCRADMILLTRTRPDSHFSFANKPVFSSRHQLADYALDLLGTKVKLDELRKLKVCAFAGIASPESFFQQLLLLGMNVKTTVALKDHSQFDRKALSRVETAASGCDALITTEKDAVKLSSMDMPLPCYQMPMNIDIDDAALFKQLVFQKLEL